MSQEQNLINSLDLGCGEKPRNPLECENAYGLDIRNLDIENVVCADVVLEPIPFSDGFFDVISAYDFVEHIPRVIYAPNLIFPFVKLMDEICRCLRPGGQFLSFTPSFPSPVAFQDPTHVNIISESTFPNYFCEPLLWAKMYGFSGKFRLAAQKWNKENTHLITVMKKLS